MPWTERNLPERNNKILRSITPATAGNQKDSILARLAKLFLPMDDLDLAPGLPLSSSSLPYDTCGYIQYMFFQFL